MAQTRANAGPEAFSSARQEKQTSVAEWVLLRELYERGKAAPGELAERLGLTRGAVSKIIDKLEGKGWVQTDAKKGDNRYRLLSLRAQDGVACPCWLRSLTRMIRPTSIALAQRKR